MRIRVIQKPGQFDIDGYNISHFEVGNVYDVHPTIGALFVVEGWGVPVYAIDSASDAPGQRRPAKSGTKRHDR